MSGALGKKDKQTVLPGGRRAVSPAISGVQIVELGNILTRSGWMMEVFRSDHAEVKIEPRQVNYVQLSPNGVTDWHRHHLQIDHLIGVGGTVKLVLWDGRKDSPTQGASEVIRFGALRPVMVIVPPGVWHAMR